MIINILHAITSDALAGGVIASVFLNFRHYMECLLSCTLPSGAVVLLHKLELTLT